MRAYVIACVTTLALGGLGLGLEACSSTSTGNGNPGNGNTTTTGDAGDTSQNNPPPAGSFTATFGPVVVHAGEEHTQCITRRLGNPDAMHVGQIHNVLSEGSHHLIVYEVSDTVEQTTPYDCRPFADTLDPTKGAPLMISQKKDDLLALPDGVAYTIAANQMVRLEMHYINPSSKDLTVSSTTTVIPVDDATFKFEADFLLIGSTNIHIPPQASATLGPTYIGLPAAYNGVNWFAITGHEHQYGTNVRVSSASAATDTGKPVYDVPNWLWSEPKTLMAAPPFNVPDNGGFNLTCDWHNTSDKAITFGESAEDEMCFFWAYYYPKKAGSTRVLLQQ